MSLVSNLAFGTDLVAIGASAAVSMATGILYYGPIAGDLFMTALDGSVDNFSKRVQSKPPLYAHPTLVRLAEHLQHSSVRFPPK